MYFERNRQMEYGVHFQHFTLIQLIHLILLWSKLFMVEVKCFRNNIVYTTVELYSNYYAALILGIFEAPRANSTHSDI